MPKSERDTPQQATATDLQILKDKSLSYRVLNFASGAFNENNTSYFHKSIGGYHPAKLRRYQEMIDKYIAPEMQTAMQAIANKGGVMSEVDGRKLFPILNMLNAKYFIVPLQGNATTSIQNPYAQGNGWFVDKLTYVADANAEYAGVGKIDVSHEAVADKKFEPILGQTQTNDSTARVVLTKYEPNNMTYTVNSTKGGVVVFSEVYYPGWTATIDGQPAELGRVNYILRALNVKAGKHEVVLDFHPTSISTTETIAYAALIVLLLAICVAIYSEKKKQKITKE